MKSLVVLGGSSHSTLTAAICERLAIPQGNVKLSKFSNHETNVEIFQSVRGNDVYIVQSGCGQINDNLFELLIMIAACKIASARKVTAVIPCFPYSRQPDVPYQRNGMPLTRFTDEGRQKLAEMIGQPFPHAVTSNAGSRATSPTKHLTDSTAGSVHQSHTSLQQSSEGGEHGSLAHPTPIPAHVLQGANDRQSPGSPARSASPFRPDAMPVQSAGYKLWVAKPGTLIANMLVAAGADHIITMDLHDAQFQGFFDIPVDNLLGQPLMVKYIQERIPNWQDAVIVSPDAGGAKRATSIADKLNMGFALIHKDRRHSTSSLTLVGNVKGHTCIIIDDILDTATTVTRAAKLLVNNGATKIYTLVTHGIMSGDAVERLNRSPIDELIVSNSVPQDEHLRNCPKLKVFDVAPILAESIRRIHNGESVSFLFDVVPLS
ncbi:ribose-phosphate pyrophosphokinase [Sorochytrium milnesiophthora]